MTRFGSIILKVCTVLPNYYYECQRQCSTCSL